MLLTIEDVARVLNTRERHVYQLTLTEELPSVKVGAFVRVPRRALYDYLVTQQRGDQGLPPYITEDDIVAMVAAAIGGAA